MRVLSQQATESLRSGCRCSKTAVKMFRSVAKTKATFPFCHNEPSVDERPGALFKINNVLNVIFLSLEMCPLLGKNNSKNQSWKASLAPNA